MATGEVEHINSTAGYGYIETAGSGDVLFYVVDAPEIEEGDSVEFDIDESCEALQATDIKRV